MQWTELTIHTNEEALEPLTAMLEGIGVTDCVVTDPRETIAFLKENADQWDLVDEELVSSVNSDGASIKIYVPLGEEGEELSGRVSALIDEAKASDTLFSDITVSSETVSDEDWEFNWKDYFKGFELGERLYIRPVWEEGDREGRITVITDPGLGFGSGMHETTRLALLALERFAPDAEVLADIGSGSGILSAAAAKLGAKKVIAIDIDPQAVEASERCAEINGVSDRMTVYCGDLADKITSPVDVIAANIFAGTICKLSEQTDKVLSRGGYFIATGIIEDSADDVRSAFDKNGIELLYEQKMGDWLLFVGQKK